MLNKQLVKVILENAQHLRWSLQGFGMLRTYLDAGRVYRLQIWDERYRVDDVSLIHDHPWHFKSTIIAGEIYNTRYVKRQFYPDIGNLSMEDALFNEKTIIAGEGGGVTGDALTVILDRQEVELYKEGDTYTQRWNEIHESNYTDGSITVIEREWPFEDRDRAKVYYPVGKEWVSAEPRSVNHDEIEDIVDNALERWF